MAYNPNIPQPTDQLNNSQPQLLANFQALTSFGNGYADFPVQGTAPTLSSGDTGLYTLNNATTSANEMYIVKPSVDAPTNVPFTASSMSNRTMADSFSGWSYLPSGLLMKWGFISVLSDGTVEINVGGISGGPNFNFVFQIYITPTAFFSGGANFTAIQNFGFEPTAAGNFSVFSLNSSSVNKTGINYLFLGV